MARNKIKKVKVETLPNGYALTVGKKEYLLFNEKELAAAVFYHILLENDEYVNKNISENLMTAAATWPTAGEAIQGNATLMAEMKDVRREARIARKQLSNLNDRMDALTAEHAELKEKYAKASIKAEQTDKYKERSEMAYDLYNREKKYSSDLQKELLKMKRIEEKRQRSAERKKRKNSGDTIAEQ